MVRRLSVLLFIAFICLNSIQGSATIRINEVMASNGTTLADEDGDFGDWIELYNIGHEPVNLHGWGLSDDYQRPFRWVFPEVALEPGRFLVVFASNKDRRDPANELHTNFAISSSGEDVVLTRPNGDRVDELPPRFFPRDVSVGRQPDGTGAWYFFDEPTPGATNATTAFETILDPPTFSHQSGFYSEAFELSLYSNHDDVTIHYTLDGSTPTKESPKYTGPIPIASREGEPNGISMIPTSHYVWYPPRKEVFKATVVRAAAFRGNATLARADAKTYFVGEDVQER